jgi:hypothetical protein
MSKKLDIHPEWEMSWEEVAKIMETPPSKWKKPHSQELRYFRDDEGTVYGIPTDKKELIRSWNLYQLFIQKIESVLSSLSPATKTRIDLLAEKKEKEKENPRRKDEVKHWVSFQKKLDIIRHNCMKVINGEATGVYFYGRGGTSKTFTIKEIFDKAVGKNRWCYHRGHITPQGFFELLQSNDIHHLDRHIVFDDIYSVFKSDKDREYFLSALETTDDMVRDIPYTRAGKPTQHAFFGKGIVCISNIDLASHKKDVMLAIRDRFAIVHEHKPTDQEIWSLFYHLADHPEFLPKTLPRNSEAALMVADYLFDHLPDYPLRATIRLYRKAIQEYYSKSKIVPWKKAILIMLGAEAEKVEAGGTPKQDYKQIALTIHKEGGTTAVKVEKWKKATTTEEKPTGLAQSYFYELIKEARAEGSLPKKGMKTK